MCGIAGCVMPSGSPPDRIALERMRDALHHRGPDDHGILVEENVGLVHTRLAIVEPTPAARQPMRHAPSGSAVTYNGEVFNHSDLRRELERERFSSGSDTETALEALCEWGDEALIRFNGLFALAFLDRPGRRLVLSRDRFGVKALYLARHGGGIWFASEIGALLALGVPARPRRDVVEQILRRTWSTGRPSAIEGIERLPPGTTLEIRLEDLRTHESRWYRPADVVDPDLAERLARNPREANKAELERCLRAAVERRLLADVPVGAMCSGGVDSSLITAYAHDADPSLRVYCAPIADQPDADEGPWARMVTGQLGTDLLEVPVTAQSFREGLVRATSHYEYPSAHVSMVPIAAIAARAHDEGVKPILVGEAADELFGGYGLRIQRELVDIEDENRTLRLAKRRALRALRDRIRQPPGPGAPVCPDAISFDADCDAAARESYSHHRGPRADLEVELIKQLSIGPLPTLINRLDKNGMQNSIEMRLPFLDRDLVELALNMPVEHRVKPRHKGLLRELALDRFGPEIGLRPKKQFRFPVRDYIRAAAPTEFLDDGVLREVLGAERAAWRRRWMDGTPQQESLIWSGEIWARLTLEGHSIERVESDLWPDGPDVAAADTSSAGFSTRG